MQLVADLIEWRADFMPMADLEQAARDKGSVFETRDYLHLSDRIKQKLLYQAEDYATFSATVFDSIYLYRC